MATLKTIAPATWINTAEHTADNNYSLNLVVRFNHFADSQKQSHTLWFFMVLMVHGVLLLPLPAVLLYYYNAPIGVLAITMACFFTNLIANMGGAGIRATLLFFGGSILLHVLMALIYIL
jgi:hypothetical protein